MALFFRLGLAGLLLLLTVLPASAETLYNQPPFSEKELNQFIADLPRFRAWIKTNKEKAHPIVNEAVSYTHLDVYKRQADPFAPS